MRIAVIYIQHKMSGITLSNVPRKSQVLKINLYMEANFAKNAKRGRKIGRLLNKCCENVISQLVFALDKFEHHFAKPLNFWIV